MWIDDRLIQIQTLDKILIYEAPGDVPHDMKYKSTYKISKNIECSSMIVTASNIIMCQDKRLHCYNFAGDEIRVWFVRIIEMICSSDRSVVSSRQMDSPIRYLKLIGGPVGYEAVVIGLKNGGVYQIFVNNPFPQFIAKQTGVILCIDMNIDRTKVAIIDETGTLYVYNIRTKELLYQVTNPTIVYGSIEKGRFSFRLGTKCSNSGLEYFLSGYVSLLRRWIFESKSVGFSRITTKFTGNDRSVIENETDRSRRTEKYRFQPAISINR